MAALVQLHIEQDFSNNEQDEEKFLVAERGDDYSSEEDGHVQDEDSAVWRHHHNGNGVAAEFTFSEIVGVERQEMAGDDGEDKKDPARSENFPQHDCQASDRIADDYFPMVREEAVNKDAVAKAEHSVMEDKKRDEEEFLTMAGFCTSLRVTEVGGHGGISSAEFFYDDSA